MWYSLIVKDLSHLGKALEHFNTELESAQSETQIKGIIEQNCQQVSGHMAWRYSQLQEIEAILKYLNIQYDRLRSRHYKAFLETYNRTLSDRSIEKYIDGVDEVCQMMEIINEVALVRNKYLAIIKALETKGFQISNIVKLRAAGLDDASI